MKILSVTVKNFRNLVEQSITLSDQVNIIVGDNAQGKTNLLESVYLCCLGKSARTDHDKDMINWNESEAKVELSYLGKAGERTLSVTINKDKKTAFVNGVALQKIGELLGYLNCIYFSPEEIKVIKESPSERRRFLDVDLCQLDPNYFRSLVRFNRILMQRNNLLKNSTTLSNLTETLDSWDVQLAKEGARIIYKRRTFCDQLTPLAKQTHLDLTKTENLNLQYVTQVNGKDIDELAVNYQCKLHENIERDFGQRFTSFGCQRDDIKFEIDGVDIRTFGSQGQQRTTALSLKLAELELFNLVTGEYPILLLDDVMSELDRNRQKALLNLNPNIQVILTTTRVEPSLLKNVNYKKYKIVNGKAK